MRVCEHGARNSDGKITKNAAYWKCDIKMRYRERCCGMAAVVHSPAQDRRLATVVGRMRAPFAWQFEDINTSRATERQITASGAEQQAIDIKHRRTGQRKDLEDSQ